MPQKPPRPNPPPPLDCDSDGAVNVKESLRAMRKWDGQPHWQCGHVRRGSTWSQYNTFFGAPLSYWARHADSPAARVAITQELRERAQECPPCARATLKRRQHWSAIAIAAALLLLVCWRCL